MAAVSACAADVVERPLEALAALLEVGDEARAGKARPPRARLAARSPRLSASVSASPRALRLGPGRRRPSPPSSVEPRPTPVARGAPRPPPRPRAARRSLRRSAASSLSSSSSRSSAASRWRLSRRDPALRFLERRRRSSSRAFRLAPRSSFARRPPRLASALDPPDLGVDPGPLDGLHPPRRNSASRGAPRAGRAGRPRSSSTSTGREHTEAVLAGNLEEPPLRLALVEEVLDRAPHSAVLAQAGVALARWRVDPVVDELVVVGMHAAALERPARLGRDRLRVVVEVAAAVGPADVVQGDDRRGSWPASSARRSSSRSSLMTVYQLWSPSISATSTGSRLGQDVEAQGRVEDERVRMLGPQRLDVELRLGVDRVNDGSPGLARTRAAPAWSSPGRRRSRRSARGSRASINGRRTSSQKASIEGPGGRSGCLPGSVLMPLER